jgi:hypothetical protein
VNLTHAVSLRLNCPPGPLPGSRPPWSRSLRTSRSLPSRARPRQPAQWPVLIRAAQRDVTAPAQRGTDPARYGAHGRIGRLSARTNDCRYTKAAGEALTVTSGWRQVGRTSRARTCRVGSYPMASFAASATFVAPRTALNSASTLKIVNVLVRPHSQAPFSFLAAAAIQATPKSKHSANGTHLLSRGGMRRRGVHMP